jgi:hypothetical protein
MKHPAQRSTVVVLAYYYPPQNTSGADRPARFARYLPRHGWSPRVIAGPAGGLPAVEGVERVPGQGESLRVRLLTLGAGWFQRLLLPYQEHVPWIPAALAAAGRLLEKNPSAVLLSTSPPIAVHLVALALKRRHGIRWVADCRDPLGDNPFRDSRRARLYDPWIERQVFAYADTVIANTARVADLWRERYPGFRDKIRVLWNGFDSAAIPVCPPPAPGRRRAVMAHIGSLYADRHPGLLLSSVARLLDRRLLSPEELEIRLVGPIERIPFSLEEPPFNSLVQSGVLTAGGQVVPKAEAIAAAAAADYLLLLDLNRHNTGLQVPAKLFEYVLSGRPILAFTPPDSSVEDILSQSGAQYACVSPLASPEEVDTQVLEFLRSPRRLSRPSAWFLRHFDAAEQTQALSEWLSGTATGSLTAPAGRRGSG